MIDLNFDNGGKRPPPAIVLDLVVRICCAWPLVAACVFNGISVGGWNALGLISAELFPTSVRRTVQL